MLLPLYRVKKDLHAGIALPDEFRFKPAPRVVQGTYAQFAKQVKEVGATLKIEGVPEPDEPETAPIEVVGDELAGRGSFLMPLADVTGRHAEREP